MQHNRSSATELQQHRIPITFFDDRFARVQYQDNLTLPELAEEILKFSEPHKSGLPWLKLATFGDVASRNQCLRTNANLREVHGVEIDYDVGVMNFDFAAIALQNAGLRGLVYTSASYVKGVKEKWRVLAPLSKAYPPEARAGLVAVLNGVLGGVAAPESFVLSTAFYYGCVDHNPDHRVELVDGDFLDLRPDLASGRIGKNGKATGSGNGAAPGYDESELQALLERSQRQGHWHNSMMSVTASLVGKGCSNHEICSRTAAKCRDGYGDPDIMALIQSAREKYRVPDSDAALHPGLLAAITKDAPEAEKIRAATLDDFQAYLPTHHYVFMPTREMWPAASVDDILPRIQTTGKTRTAWIKPSRWLSQHRPLEQMTWAPGEPDIIRGRLVADGGWISRRGSRSLNLYRPPLASPSGEATQAGPWIEHVERLYGDDSMHIIKWLAHRVQRPAEKINHALVLGGAPGIGKDSLLEPVKYAIGPWNMAEISPKRLTDKFNGYGRSVILRISEVKDLGEMTRYDFYDRTKMYCAAPPDVLEINEKNKGEYYVFNICAVVMTTNYKTDGIYLPRDDRRHYVAWSKVTEQELDPGLMQRLWDWYEAGGYGHVARYLAEVDISDFDAKATPHKTGAFYDIVDANAAPESTELAELLRAIGNPAAVTLEQLQLGTADYEFQKWLRDRSNIRRVLHRLEDCGYARIRNDTTKDGMWEMAGRRVNIYARAMLSTRDQMAAAATLCRKLGAGKSIPKSR